MTALTSMPALTLQSGVTQTAAPAALAPLSRSKTVLIVADAFWADNPLFAQIIQGFDAAGLRTVVFTDFVGEPKAAYIDAAAAQGRAEGADCVFGLGGGSALDIAKMVSACLASGEPATHYALGAHPIPDTPAPLVLAPTTAGTGSEANGTAIFSDAAGHKLWAYGAGLKPVLAVLDEALLASLPPHLMAWCGMDALIHAFEAGSNRWSNPVNQAFALRALELIVPALPKAVAGERSALSDLLLGSFYAGYAIENCGTAVAHNVSHALAAFAPIHHGLATALAFEVTLDRIATAENPALPAIAKACGTDVAGLRDWSHALMEEIGISRVLPAGFAEVSAAELAAEMGAPANAPMRSATVPDLSDADLSTIAEAVLALPKAS